MKQEDASHILLAKAHGLGLEARAGKDDHAVLKVWLRLLASSTQIETEIRRRMREQFGTSLARFDYMAQLFRFGSGIRMSLLSRYLMVTGGNVTALTDELEEDGLVVRESSPDDRRSWVVSLTPAGREAFDCMAKEHEQWVLELFAGLDARAVQQLYGLLGSLRVHLVQRDQPE